MRDLHEGGHDLTVLHELRAATDLALRATKVTAQSLGRAMSTLVVQERHLWLCLTDMKEQECPWSRYPDMLWYSQMPRPQAGEPRTTGTQYQGFGWAPNCIGISIASSC